MSLSSSVSLSLRLSLSVLFLSLFHCSECEYMPVTAGQSPVAVRFVSVLSVPTGVCVVLAEVPGFVPVSESE